MLSQQYFKYDQESARWWCRATISRCWWLPHPGETRLKIYHAAVSLPLTSPHTKPWSRIKGRLAMWGGSEVFVSMAYSTRSWWDTLSKSQKMVTFVKVSWSIKSHDQQFMKWRSTVMLHIWNTHGHWAWTWTSLGSWNVSRWHNCNHKCKWS